MSNSNKYTNTLYAAAYSLGVDVEILNQSLEHLRRASVLKQELLKHEYPYKDFYTITLVLEPKVK
jgi:hypothetical protein